MPKERRGQRAEAERQPYPYHLRWEQSKRELDVNIAILAAKIKGIANKINGVMTQLVQ